ncbi:MAG: hypothetical protein L3J88_08135 [Gammaproteobacteria bacterium]|nr:hypothetical protein [Gammaproteobacteria bacterium]MCF6363299.1 hypothetical protein [Gammaproteobacteria bacterium]
MIESAAAILASTQAVSGAEPPSLQAGYGVSLTDLASFEQSLAAAGGRVEMQQNVSAPSEAARTVFKPLEYINNEAAELSQFAKVAAASGNEMTPGELVMLTVRSQEFMFHCQLTSNVANRASDGLQQLFRQQS